MQNNVRTVLVTGGSTGIGAAVSNLLSKNGMTVYAASRSGRCPEGCEERSNLVPVVMDVNDEAAIAGVVDRILREQGSLDAVVCNAGNGIAGPVEETSLDEVRSQFETTFFGVVKTVQVCLPIFRKQGRGRLVTISSVAAVAALPYQAFYSCAKAGVLQLTKAVAIEMKEYGVQACCVMPGDVKTSFSENRRIADRAAKESSPYYECTRAAVRQMEKDEKVQGMSPDVIAKAVLRQLNRKRMSAECVPGFRFGALVVLIRQLPEHLVLGVLRKMYS